jgi:hypothetical protein
MLVYRELAISLSKQDRSGREGDRSMKARVRFVDLCSGFALATLLLTVAPASAQTVSVATYHNDNLRDGQNTQETILTTANVNSAKFGKLFSYSVDAAIYGQPLYVPNVGIAGQGTHNVVYVATENDSVYAFDADGLNTTPLWQDSLVAGGASAIPCARKGMCLVLSQTIGITSTPVIDTVGGTIYVLALTQETGGSVVDYLHALDITSGAEKFGGPVVVSASVPGTGVGSAGGMVTFNAEMQLQRPGLLLLNGVVYIAWGSFGDQNPFHGWLMGYNSTTLAQVAVFNTTPNGTRGAIWQAGGGLSADANGYIYAQTGNGTFDANAGGADYGDSFIKFSTASGLSVADSFTPDNQAVLAVKDLDLGAGAGLLLPTQLGSYPDEIVSAGKQGSIYLVDRDAMGGYSSTQNNNIQTLTGAALGYSNSPAYWNNSLYYHGKSDYLRRYAVQNGKLSATSTSHSPTTYAQGSTPSVSSNGTTNGIVWAIDAGAPPFTAPAVLHAYNALKPNQELYNSTQAGTRDAAGPGIKFSTPTIANGKVYVGTSNQLDIYGLL